MGPFMAALCLGIQKWGIENGQNWQTMVFTALVFCQFAHVIAIRSEKTSLFKLGFLSNMPLTLTLCVSLLVQLCIIYLPAFNSLMRVAPLTSLELSLCVGAALAVFCAVEIEKLLVRSRMIYAK